MFGSERFKREKLAYLKERKSRDTENGSTETLSDGETLDWDGVESLPFEPELLEEKRNRLKNLGMALRDKIRTQIESVSDGSTNDDSIEWRVCEACFKASIDKDASMDEQKERARTKTYAEIRTIQDFMFLEESRAWLPEGSEAEKKLTELFHKVYCENEQDGEDREQVIDWVIYQEHDFAGATTEAKDNLSLRLQEFDQNAKRKTPRFFLMETTKKNLKA